MNFIDNFVLFHIGDRMRQDLLSLRDALSAVRAIQDTAQQQCFVNN